MLPLDLATSRTLAQRLHILQRLSSHLPVPLLGVRGLLLRYCPEYGLPDAAEPCGDVEVDCGEGGERREHGLDELAGVEREHLCRPGEGWRGDLGKNAQGLRGHRNGGHFDIVRLEFVSQARVLGNRSRFCGLLQKRATRYSMFDRPLRLESTAEPWAAVGVVGVAAAGQ